MGMPTRLSTAIVQERITPYRPKTSRKWLSLTFLESELTFNVQSRLRFILSPRRPRLPQNCAERPPPASGGRSFGQRTETTRGQTTSRLSNQRAAAGSSRFACGQTPFRAVPRKRRREARPGGGRFELSAKKRRRPPRLKEGRREDSRRRSCETGNPIESASEEFTGRPRGSRSTSAGPSSLHTDALQIIKQKQQRLVE